MDTTISGIVRPYGRWLTGLVLIACSWLWPELVEAYALPLAIGLIALLGIPHGATDYTLFKHLQGRLLRPSEKAWFFLRYIGLMAIYGLWWWASPGSALVFFLLLSVFHFGQSNWHDLRLPAPGRTGFYLSWGLFVLGVPLLWHYEQTAAILQEILHHPLPDLSDTWRYGLLTLFSLGSISALCGLRRSGQIDRTGLGRGFLDVLVLAGLFLSTPLLLGFAVYFSLWHALDAIAEQRAFLAKKIPDFTLLDYIRITLPFAVMALLGIGMLVWYMRSQHEAVGLGWMFVGVALITLPHMLLVDFRFHHWQRKAADNLGRMEEHGLMA